jgi:hypothetical protein
MLSRLSRLATSGRSRAVAVMAFASANTEVLVRRAFGRSCDGGEEAFVVSEGPPDGMNLASAEAKAAQALDLLERFVDEQLGGLVPARDVALGFGERDGSSITELFAQAVGIADVPSRRRSARARRRTRRSSQPCVWTRRRASSR